MARPRTDFSLTKRPGSDYWQVYFYTAEGVRKRLSTGEVSRDLAMLKVAKWRSEGMAGKIETQGQGLTDEHLKAQVTFGEASDDFFSGPNCPYFQLKLKANARRAVSYVTLQKNLLTTWIGPYFNELRLFEINAAKIDSFVLHLRAKGNSANHIHNILVALKIIFATLFKIGRAPHDLSIHVPKFARRPKKAKQVLTVAQFQKLFVEGAPLAADRLSIQKWLMMCLAFCCGMRVSEIQACSQESLYLHIPDGSKGERRGYVLVDSIWERDSMELREGTKTYGKRYVPLPGVVTDVLFDFAMGNLDSPLIFASSKVKGRPLSASVLADYLNELANRCKVEVALSPHRGRDWFQSVLIGKVEQGLIDYAIGHSKGAVKDTYIHALVEQLEPVRLSMEDLLGKEAPEPVQSFADLAKELRQYSGHKKLTGGERHKVNTTEDQAGLSTFES